MVGKQPRRVPRQNTPSSPRDAGSLRRNSAGGSDSGQRGSGGGGGRGSGGGAGGGGGDDDDDDNDNNGESTPSDQSGPSRCRHKKRHADPILNDAETQQQLAQILQNQRQTAAGRCITGITTTNTVTTTYKNGQQWHAAQPVYVAKRSPVVPQVHQIWPFLPIGHARG